MHPPQGQARTVEAKFALGFGFMKRLRRWQLGIGSCLMALAAVLHAQAPAPAASVPAARFVGTWVGTQAWAIPNPPPGASNDQPVTLELQLVDGKITGTMKPFLGGDDGATIVDATIVGEELRANAIVGRPRPAGRRGGGGGGNGSIKIAFVLRNDGLKVTGTADVSMGDVPWTKFSYNLGKKRSRY
jgi:hypothetical protein